MKKIKEDDKVIKLGSPILREKADKVNCFSSLKISNIIESMLKVLIDTNGVGLAAPQIAESICIVVVASKPSKRYPSAPKMKPVVMINPTFEILSGMIHKDWEGCLSIPGIRALVPRYENIAVSYFDQQGEFHQLKLNGFVARIFQHEYDHLNGLVFLDRVEDNKDIISEYEFQKLMA